MYVERSVEKINDLSFFLSFLLYKRLMAICHSF
jgi:hypothetical protein